MARQYDESAIKGHLARLEQQAQQRDREAGIAARLGMNTQEAYYWGRVTRRTQAYQPAARSADAAIYESQDLMHRRTRSEVENNPLMKRVQEALCDLVVGEQMQTLADPIDATVDLDQLLSSGEFDDVLRYALESDQLFEEWFLDPRQIDVEGKLAGPDFQRMALSENITVGDAFLLRVTKKRERGRLPLAYQLIEREQLDLSRDRPAGPGQNKIVNGIELDALGREVGFWVLDAHPYDDFAQSTQAGSATFVPAARMIHLCAFRRPSQAIGVTWLHAVGQSNFDRDKLVGAELQSAVKQALLSLILKLKSPQRGQAGLGIDDGEGSTDDYGNPEVKLGSSSHAVVIGPDDDVDLVESNRPGNNFDSFVALVDHDTAGGTGLSYYTLTGRYNDTNFTSLRGALLAEDVHIRPVQGWFARRLAIPMRQEFTRLAAAMGMFRSVTPGEFLRDERRFLRMEALGAGRELLDPEAETNAALGRLRGGLTTLKIECARRGLHWIKVLRQASLENRVAQLLGVTLDFSKGQGGQVEKTTRDSGGNSGNRNSQTKNRQGNR